MKRLIAGICLPLFLLLLYHPGYSQRIFNYDEALEMAKFNSPDIRQVQLAYDRSKELLNVEDASLKSQFSLTINPFYYQNTRQFDNFSGKWYTGEIKQSEGTFSIVQPIKWTDGTLAFYNRFLWQESFSDQQLGATSRTTYTNDLYLDFRQPIFTYNRTMMQYQEVQLDMENALLNYQIQELNLEQRVAMGFYDVYQKKMTLIVAQEELVNTNASRQIIENKVNAGLIATEELYQAEVNLATSKSSVYNSKVAHENALDNLKQILGLPLEEEIAVMADVTETQVQADLSRAIEHGLKYRMELRQRHIDLVLAKNNIVRSAATNEFKGDISLRYGIFGNNQAFGSIYQQPSENQELSLRFEIPLYDWGAKDSRVKASETSLKSNKISEAEQKKNIKIEIRQAYRNIENQKLQTEIAKQNVKVSQLTYDINLERYQNGDLTSMDLNLFQTQLSEKKSSLIDAIISYKLALLDLKIRSLWDFEKDRSVINYKNNFSDTE